MEDGKEVPIQPLSYVENIVEVSRVTRSGRVFAPTFQQSLNSGKKIVKASVEPKKVEGKTSGVTMEKDVDDLLKIIKMSDYKIVDQLLQAPSKIFILALLMNYTAHQESLMRLLDQDFVE